MEKNEPKTLDYIKLHHFKRTHHLSKKTKSSQSVETSVHKRLTPAANAEYYSISSLMKLSSCLWSFNCLTQRIIISYVIMASGGLDQGNMSLKDTNLLSLNLTSWGESQHRKQLQWGWPFTERVAAYEKGKGGERKSKTDEDRIQKFVMLQFVWGRSKRREKKRRKKKKRTY